MSLLVCLSYGISLADVVKERQAPCAVALAPSSYEELAGKLKALVADVSRDLQVDARGDDKIETTMFLHLRYRQVNAHIQTHMYYECILGTWL